MTPRERSWKELTWSWPYEVGQSASGQSLEAAARMAWPYAQLCAWTYLSDQDSAHDLMDHAVENGFQYLNRHPESSLDKLARRIKSVIRRRAKQLANKRGREVLYGSLADLEFLHAESTEVEQRAIANEMFERLSPFARAVFRWRWIGYTWREIARQLGLDHTVVRRAYFRELESLLRSLSRSGDFPQ